jgi:hypothetical protein
MEFTNQIFINKSSSVSGLHAYSVFKRKSEDDQGKESLLPIIIKYIKNDSEFVH